VEVPRGVRPQSCGSSDLAEAPAKGSDHGPVSLGVPLLDPAVVEIVGHVEVAHRIRREGRWAGVEAVSDDHRPVALGISRLDPVTEDLPFSVTDVKVAGRIYRRGGGRDHLAGGCAVRIGNYGPVPRGVSLPDPAVPVVCHIKAAGGV